MQRSVMKHDKDSKTRADILIVDLKEGKQIQHKMLNSAKKYVDIQDLYFNSICEWFENPKCQIALICAGDFDE